jgi:hypothetical protein
MWPVLLGLVVADAGLLGASAAVGQRLTSTLIRLAGLALAIVLPGALWQDPFALRAILALLAGLASVMFAIMCFLNGRCWIGIIQTGPSTVHSLRPTVSSVRRLLFIVAAIAATLAPASWIHFWPDGWSETAVAINVFAPSLLASQLMVAWAVFGGATLLLRIFIAVQVIAIISFAARMTAGHALRLEELDAFGFIHFMAMEFIAINIIQCSATLATLLVLRARGWRVLDSKRD